MSGADPNARATAAPAVAGKKKRSVVERVLVWGGILVLLAVVLVEWSSKKFYGDALRDLDTAVQSRDADGLKIALPLAKARHHIRGFTFKSEQPKKPHRKMIYTWPSLFKTFKVVMTVDDTDQVLSVDSQDASDDGPLRPSGSLAEMEARFHLKSPKVKTGDDVIELARQEKPLSDQSGTRYGSLIRELVRQSFLVTARCELGLTTRDSAFGEVLLFENAEPRFPLQVVVALQFRHEPPNPVCNIEVSRVQPDGTYYIWKKSLEIHGRDLEDFVSQLETLSRGEFVQVLQDAGFSSLTRPQAESTTVESGGDPSLDVVSQFKELRRLSAELAAHGESDSLLERLVRVYANLGSLTDFYWSSTSKSFKARSLLYAERYFAKRGETAETLAHRAYARALAGRHSAALADVSTVMKLENETKPVWLELIDAYCSYKPDVLRRTKGDYKELSLYLLMRVFHQSGSSKQFTAAIDRFLEANPASLRACQSLCETGDLGSYRSATEVRFDEVWSQIYHRLGSISDLPTEARKVVDAQLKLPGINPIREHASRIALFKALRNSGTESSDASEPSWIMLAELLEDATFVQVTDVLYCEKSMLGVSAERSLTKLRPLVATHRLKEFIEGFTDDQQRNGITFSNFSKKLSTADYEPQMEILIGLYHSSGDQAYASYYQRMFANYDLIFNDLQSECKYRSPPHEQRAQVWREICPYHPASVTFSIQHDWSNVKEFAVEWEETYSKCPNVMIALGQRFRNLHRSQDAIRCLKKSIDTEPSYEAYLALADEYYEQGDLVTYQETLEDSLDTPDFGLEKAEIQQRLAYFLMRKGKWEEAQPFAAQAAATYSGWGLNTAARCAEGLKDWRTAEDLHRRVSQRYADSAPDWYFWCVRTGRGDIRAARALADTYWQSFVSPYLTNQKDSLFYRHLIDGENEKALEIIRTLKVEPFTVFDTIDLQLDPRWVLHGAVLADEFKDVALRDKLLKCLPILCARHGSSQVVPLANLFARALKDPDNFQWDALTFDELMTSAFYDEVTFLYFVAGRFLETHGQEELARRYLLTAATSFQVDKRSCMLASLILRSQKTPIGESRLSELPDDLDAFCVLINKAKSSRGKRKFEEAEKYLEEASALGLSPSTVLIGKSLLAEARRRYSEAIQNLEAAVQANPNSVDAHYRLAWLLATCSDETARDGAAAMTHAQAAYQLEQFKSYPTLTTLAAAYAETGQFKQAAEQEQLAVQLVSDYPERYDRLQLYLHDKPFHTPPIEETTETAEKVESQ